MSTSLFFLLFEYKFLLSFAFSMPPTRLFLSHTHLRLSAMEEKRTKKRKKNSYFIAFCLDDYCMWVSKNALASSCEKRHKNFLFCHLFELKSFLALFLFCAFIDIHLRNKNLKCTHTCKHFHINSIVIQRAEWSQFCVKCQ